MPAVSLTKTAQLAGVAALAVVTVVLVVLAMTRSVAVTSVDSTQEAPAPDVTRPPAPATTVSVLGDEHVLREGSWFYRSVPAEDGGPIERGIVLAEPDAGVRSLDAKLDQVEAGDVVLLAGGSVDVQKGRNAKKIAADVRGLVRDVQDRDARPVLVLLPPSNQRGFVTKLVNRKLRAYGERRSLPVLDIFGPLSTPPGDWKKKYTDDGAFANEAGAKRQAEVVTGRLAWIAAAQQAQAQPG